MTDQAVDPMKEFRKDLVAMGGQFEAALPAHIPAERFVRVVLTAVQTNPELVECDRRSLWNACVKAAQDGLLPDGREGAMVARWSPRGPKTVSWQPMIAGIRKKARNSGQIADWMVHAVYSEDFFAYELGDEPSIRHKPALTKRGELIACYSICKMKDGEISRDLMGIDEIRSIRDRSDAWKAFQKGAIKSTPWSTDEQEMAKKTVARRHSKQLPLSSDLDDLIRRDDEIYDRSAGPAQIAAPGSPTPVATPATLRGKLEAIVNENVPQLTQSAGPQMVDGERVDADGVLIENEDASQQRGAAGEGDASSAQASTAPAAERKKPGPKPGSTRAKAPAPANGNAAATSTEPAPRDPAAFYIAGRLFADGRPPGQWSDGELVSWGFRGYNAGVTGEQIIPAVLQQSDEARHLIMEGFQNAREANREAMAKGSTAAAADVSE